MRTPVAGTLLVSSILVFAARGAAAQCATAPSGLVSWWPAEGGAQDIAGGNPGTALGGLSFTTAKVGQGFVFDSDDDGVTIAHSTTLDVNSPGFSAEFWMKGTKASPNASGPAIFEKSHGFVDATGWAFQVTGDTGFPRFAIGTGSGFPEITGAVDVLDGNFHHVAGTWDDATDTMRLYVDGSDRGSATNATPANNTRAVNVGFASGGGTPQRFFAGIVDELAVYNRALSSSEIQAIYDAGAAGKCPRVRVWVGGSGASWATAANWNPSGAPASGDVIRIPAGSGSSVVDAAVTIRSLTLPAGFTNVVGVNAALTIGQDLVVTSGTLAVGPGSLAVTGSVTVNGGTLNGSIAGPGQAVTLTAGGVLKGSVTVGRSVVVGPGGRISPGE